MAPLRADRGIRLWLPFDCRISSCRSGGEASLPPSPNQCDNKDRSSNWTLVSTRKDVLSLKCYKSDFHRLFCGNSVNIDWWWAGDVALADSFHQTFDKFTEYSQLIRGMLRFHNSAPHHYWGLHFFHFNHVRERCQLGHAMLTHVDFTLGRFAPNGLSTPTCRLNGWKHVWRPPPPQACNASAIAGYLMMCPATTRTPILKSCSAQPAEHALNASTWNRSFTRAADADRPRRSSGGMLPSAHESQAQLEPTNATSSVKPKAVRAARSETLLNFYEKRRATCDYPAPARHLRR